MNSVLPLASLQAGMVLAEAASTGGQTLLAAGTVLTTTHLAMLKERQVRSLVIVDAGSKPAPPDAKLVLTTDKLLRPRFRCTDLSHPAMKEMYRLALLRYVRLGGLKPQGDGHGN